MTNSDSNKTSILQKLKESVTLKIITILFLCLLLMIPVFSIQDLIRERSGLKLQIENDVAQAYGAEQKLVPPILKIPYLQITKDHEGKVHEFKGLMTVMPDQLKIEGDIETETRKRSIYNVIVYKSAMKITGNFALPDLSLYKSDEYFFDFQSAYLTLGISDNNGLVEDCFINVSGESLNLSPGARQDALMSNSLSTPIFTVDGMSNVDFNFNMKLKGTRSLQFIPIAKNATVSLSSSWTSPSFVGSSLPSSYDITKDGFVAKWNSNQYKRKYPQFWLNDAYNFLQLENAFGVKLIEPIDSYAKNIRTSKYALLIIGLTFGIFFFFEIMFKRNIHPVQYTMIGFALSTFYLLLISLTEHIGFDYAYFISSIATISLIVVYSHFIIRSKKAISILILLMLSLFSYIFIILQLEDFALLAGSIGLFVILGLVMFLSRNIDWYNLKSGEN